MYFEAHFLSASLQIPQISRPDKLTDYSPSLSRSSYVSCLAYLLKISDLVFASGKSNLIVISVLETNAGSKSIFLFVAHITRTSPSDSNESIFLNKVDKMRRVASCSPVSLLVARESISSINKITLPSA